MNKINRILALILSISLIMIIGCEDRSDLTAPQAPNTGEADFTNFVSIGNSLTAGYQNASLYESTQIYSFGKLIADQVGTDFVQPLISEPGIPGKLEIVSLSPDIVFTPNSGFGESTNLDYKDPYNNLGVPGAILFDLIDETDFQQKTIARGNPFFSLVLRNQEMGKSIIEQALNLQATFITLWIGNNDVLGYATSGGTSGTDAATGKLPTDVPTFTSLYNMVGNALTDTTGHRKIAAANIPDVQNIPYFTTVGPQMGAGIEAAMSQNPAIMGLFYQKNGETVATGLASPDDLYTGTLLITLTGGAYAGLLGDTEGKYYASIGETPPPGIDTNQPFGFHPQNPWPDRFVLDADEIVITKDATTAFNGVIKSTVDANSDTWVLVDVNKFFAGVADGGMMIDGINFSTSFILGNTFSLDGVHPTTRGYAVIANEFIKKINNKFGASISQINVSTLPASVPLAKTSISKESNYILKNTPLKNISM